MPVYTLMDDLDFLMPCCIDGNKDCLLNEQSAEYLFFHNACNLSSKNITFWVAAESKIGFEI